MFFRKISVLLSCLCLIAAITGCAADPRIHQYSSASEGSTGLLKKISDSESGSMDSTENADPGSSSGILDTSGDPASDSLPSIPAQGASAQTAAADTAQPSGPVSLLEDAYPYDIAKDRETFDGSRCDIVVGDRLYMTQINDWFINFQDYENKTVEIEGMYIRIGNYTLVGRNGPTCPYCTGGYVDFEFKSDQDLSVYTSESSWISVKGILRAGHAQLSSGQSVPFYYIEAIEVSPLDEPGVNPITD